MKRAALSEKADAASAVAEGSPTKENHQAALDAHQEAGMAHYEHLESLRRKGAPARKIKAASDALMRHSEKEAQHRKALKS